MENILLINANKPSTLDFEVDIQGIDNTKKITVRFCMYVGKIMYCFKAKPEKKNSSKYIVEIPKLPNIPKTTHNFTVEVIADGYYFEALKGEANVSGDPLAHVTPTKPNVEVVKKETKPKKKEVKESDKIEEPISKGPVKLSTLEKAAQSNNEDVVKKIISNVNKNPDIQPKVANIKENRFKKIKEIANKVSSKPVETKHDITPIIKPNTPALKETILEKCSQDFDKEKDAKIKEVLENLNKSKNNIKNNIIPKNKKVLKNQVKKDIKPKEKIKQVVETKQVSNNDTKVKEMLESLNKPKDIVENKNILLKKGNVVDL